MPTPIAHSGAQGITAKKALSMDGAPPTMEGDAPAASGDLAAAFTEALASATLTRVPGAPDAAPASGHTGATPRDAAHDRAGASPRLDPPPVYPLALLLHPLALPQPTLTPALNGTASETGHAEAAERATDTRHSDASTGAGTMTQLAPRSVNHEPPPALGWAAGPQTGPPVPAGAAGPAGQTQAENTGSTGPQPLATALDVSSHLHMDGSDPAAARSLMDGPREEPPDTAAATTHPASSGATARAVATDGAVSAPAHDGAARALLSAAMTQPRTSQETPSGPAPAGQPPGPATARLQARLPLRETATAVPGRSASPGISEPGNSAPRMPMSQSGVLTGAPSAATRARQVAQSVAMPPLTTPPEEHDQTPRSSHGAGTRTALAGIGHDAGTPSGGTPPTAGAPSPVAQPALRAVSSLAEGGQTPHASGGAGAVESLLADLAARPPSGQQHDERLAGIGRAPRPEIGPATDGSVLGAPAPNVAPRGATASPAASPDGDGIAALAAPRLSTQPPTTQSTLATGQLDAGRAPSAAAAPATLAPRVAEAILPPMNELFNDHTRHGAGDSAAPPRPGASAGTGTPAGAGTVTPPRNAGDTPVSAALFGPAPSALMSTARAAVSGDALGHRATTEATDGKPSTAPGTVVHTTGALGHEATTTPVLPRALDLTPTGHAHDSDAAPAKQSANGATLRPIVEGVFVRQAALRTTPSSSSFHVVLQPRAMGLVTVHVERNEAGLQVTLAPRLAETQALLDKHLPDLIAQLNTGLGDGGATRVSVVAPGSHGPGESQAAPATAGQSGAMAPGHGSLADSGARQPFDGRGAAPEWSFDERGAAPAMTPAPAARVEVRRAPISRAAASGAARIDVQA